MCELIGLKPLRSISIKRSNMQPDLTIITNGKSYADVRIKDANYDAKILIDIEFEYVEFQDCSFVETVFENCRFIDCTFKTSDMSLCKAKYTQFLDVLFEDCRVVGVNWSQIQSNLGVSIEFSHSVVNDSIFTEVDFRGSRLDHCKIRRCVFSHSNLQETNFQGSDLEHTIFQHVDLRKADFRNAQNYFLDILGDIKLKGASFSPIEAQNLLKSLEIKIE